jgi:hypothetical protein
LTSKSYRKLSADSGFFLPFNEISTNSNGSHIGWKMEGGVVTHNFESKPIIDQFLGRIFSYDFFLKICIIGILNLLKGKFHR